MDTQNAATIEVPNFKLAKVGKDRDRKRGGGGWLSGGRGAGSGFSGAVGGSGSTAGGLFGLGASATKALLILGVSTIVSAGSWQYGRMMSARGATGPKGQQEKLFADKGGAQKYDDLSGVIKAENSIPNSLGYVSGSTDGLTPEERAQKAAEAEAARKADEESARKAAEEAKKEPESPTSAPLDPKAVADAATPKKGLTAGKFGQLGSSFGGGGGLSGGSGLSGGINRNFGAATNLNAKPQNGALGSFRNATKAASTSSPHALASKSKSKGFAKRQLDNAFTQSRQAMSAGKGETSASSAAAPFDNNPGVGNVIAGPGVGNNTAPSNGNGSGGMNPTNTGGPLGDGATAACQSGFAPDINGNCQQIQGGHGVKAARDQVMIDMAKGLMMLVAVLALLAIILEKTGYFTFLAQTLKGIIITVGVIILGIGAAILGSSGDKVVGGITMAVGALTVGSAFLNTGLLSGSSQTINMAAGVLISNALGALAASAMHKPQMD